MESKCLECGAGLGSHFAECAIYRATRIREERDHYRDRALAAYAELNQIKCKGVSDDGSVGFDCSYKEKHALVTFSSDGDIEILIKKSTKVYKCEICSRTFPDCDSGTIHCRCDNTFVINMG